MSSTNYVKELAQLALQPGWELRQLNRMWPKLEREYRHKRNRLLRSVPADDPLRLNVDLLQSIKCASDETLHTQALAYILDPSQKHGFGAAVIQALLKSICANRGRAGAARILSSLKRSKTRLMVTPEYHYRVSGFQDKSLARTDIWIETQARKKSAVVVIENKIGAAESDGQLSWYERKVSAWCNARAHNRFLLIFLTPDGRKPSTSESKNWMPISYLQLAAILRSVWINNKKAEGAGWLALYISSIMRGVLGVDLERQGDISASQIETYLRGNR